MPEPLRVPPPAQDLVLGTIGKRRGFLADPWYPRVMYVDIRRDLAFFDRSDRVLGRPSLTRFNARTGLLHPVEGARDDDVVCDISRDGKRLLLRSAEWLIVRNRNRSRITVLTEGVPACMTERIWSHWSIFEPAGRFALVGTLNLTGGSIVLNTATAAAVASARAGIDARFGEVDPIDGRLWVPHTHLKGTLLSVDCSTGSTAKARLAGGSRIVRLRFARLSDKAPSSRATTQVAHGRNAIHRSTE